jgi:agmatinase
MKTLAVCFPFDLFGSAGTGAGAQLLTDALREMLDDAKGESKPARAQSYRDHVRLVECSFETTTDYTKWREQAAKIIGQASRRKEFLLWFGGNHLSVLPHYEALGTTSDALVIQLDAHLDIYNLSDCTPELSHGNFLLHAEGDLPPVINVGHRDLFLPVEHIKQYYRHTFSAAQLTSCPDEVIEQVVKVSRGASRILIDLDCDVFDPAFFPAVSGPLPFGIAPSLVLRLLGALWSEHIVGVAISEFEPGREIRDQSLATLIWLLEWILLRRHENA